MTDKPALEPCPFCGSDMSRFAGMTPEAFARCGPQFAINCECGATGPLGDTMEQAVGEWNTRSELRG